MVNWNPLILVLPYSVLASGEVELKKDCSDGNCNRNLRGLIDDAMMRLMGSICDGAGLNVLSSYVPISVDGISSSAAGKKVIVSSEIKNSEFARCTRMKCSEQEPCCNSCGSNPSFGDFYLIPSSGKDKVGCHGNNCDWQENCVYNDGDNVLLFGTVDDYGSGIIVDHHCKAPSPVMGRSIDNTKCEDLSGIFQVPGTMYCMRVLGVGVMNGECKYISGCSENGYEFFDSIKACEIACMKNYHKENIDNCDSCSPILQVDDPYVMNKPPSFIPYEKIRICLQNPMNQDIFIPSCNVFSLLSSSGNSTNNSSSTIVINEPNNIFTDCSTAILPANNSYCSNYDLNFETSGEYYVEMKYGLNCEVNDSLENCNEVFTISSDILSVECPRTVDCMPFTDEPLWNICPHSELERFQNECPDTLILM